MQIGQSLSLSAPRFRRGGPSAPPVVARHLFIVAGQSNAAGRAPDDGGPYFPAGTLEYGATNTWAAVGNRLYHGPWETLATPSNFGFARQFAIDYLVANPAATLGFIGVAHGGTGFANGNWNKGNPSYTQAVARITAALAAAPAGSVLSGILWHQGENDGQTVAAQNAYAASLSAFVADFRADIPGGATLPFVLGGHAQGAQFYNHVTHRAIQAIPNTILGTAYAPADIPRNATLTDGIHFNAPAQRGLGARFVRALADAQANLSLGGTAVIATGTATRHNLAAGTTGAVAAVNLGTPAPGRLIVVGFQGRSSSLAPYPVSASLAGVPLTRMVSANEASGRNNTTLMYAVIPDGSTGDLSVTWSAAVITAQAACVILPVYNARPHLAGPGAFNLAGGGNAFGTSISTTVDVQAGDLIVALCGAQQTAVPTGTFNTGFSENGALGPNCTMVLGHERMLATQSRTVTCSFGAVVVNNPTLTVMALRPA